MPDWLGPLLALCALSGLHLRISSGYEGEAGQDNPDNWSGPGGEVDRIMAPTVIEQDGKMNEVPGPRRGSSLEKKLRREIEEYADPKIRPLLRERRPRLFGAANAIALSIERFPRPRCCSRSVSAATAGTTSRRRMKGGNGTEDGAPHIVRIAGCMRRLAINSNRTRSSIYPKPSRLRSNLAGTALVAPSPDDRFCSSRTTIGWRSIEVSRAVCL